MLFVLFIFLSYFFLNCIYVNHFFFFFLIFVLLFDNVFVYLSKKNFDYNYFAFILFFSLLLFYIFFPFGNAFFCF